MTGFLTRTDDLLRGRLDADRAGSVTPATLAHLLASLALFGLFYGGVMGSFGIFTGAVGGRTLQAIYSALKVPLLLLVTFGVSLPSFFVLNTILGVRDDFPHVLRSLVAAQAGLTIVLAALAPFTAFWYVSCANYNIALLFNAGMFTVASFSGQWMLRRSYRPLLARNPRHRTLLRAWLVIYAFVGIQMAWVLRPFIGNPYSPTRFFRADAWGNAYVELVRIVTRAMGS
jgi:hypothetical protein